MKISRLPEPRRDQSGRTGIIVAVSLLAVVFYFAWRSSRGPETVGGMTLEERYEIDDRLRPLLADCSFGAAFEADTTDLVQIMVSKLDAGAQLEPQRRAKADLAVAGERAQEPLMRLFQSASKDKWRGGVAKNVLNVCANADGDWGIPIALEALRSPKGDIRADGAIAIMRHPAPDLYDSVRDALLGFSLPANLSRALRALHACDPVRFAKEVPDWIEAADEIEGYIQSTVLDTAAPLVASLDDAEAAQVLREASDAAGGLLIRHRAYLLAPSARQGDEEALQQLRDLLAHELRKPRHHGSEALKAAGLVDETYVLSVTAEDPLERQQTLARILDIAEDERRTPERRAEVIQWGRKALADEAPEVREVAIHGLLARKDEEGRAALMAALRGGVPERGMAMRAMRGTLDDWPEVADQARTILIRAWEEELAGSRRGVELTTILQTLGAVPGRATGDFLLDAGDLVGQNPIRGISGYRWCAGQAFNAGPEAHSAIRARMEVEEDPFKRLDLISFVWQDFAPESLDSLLKVIDDEARSPYERLYAADRAIRMGDSERVVPVLKRIYRGDPAPALKGGLHCILWIWFGPPMT
ncbi:MAG: hypothetical protein AAF957_04735 [Planctomycetota bacterium]